MARPDSPEDADDLYDRGFDLAEAGDHEQAVAAFRRAAELGCVLAWLGLGTSLGELHRWDEAGSAFQRAAELGSADDAWAWRQRSADAGDDPQAAAVLACWRWELTRDPALEADLRAGTTDHPPARVALADLMRTDGRVEEARAVLEAGALRDELDSWLPLGDLCLVEFEDDVAAEAAYRAAIDGGDVLAHTNLGMLFRERGDLAGAVRHLSIAAEDGDELAAIHLRELLDE
ncbi:tetratricopeptide repeat protein [Modestobacter lapidis]|nr:tetratricopeptide repeat protein [Modestobacter lapidis]